MTAMADNTSQQARPAKPGPVRTCVGCGKRAPAGELVRLVVSDDGAVAVDLADSRRASRSPTGGFGRGAHVHPSSDCLGKALRGRLARSLKIEVVASPEGLAADIVAAAERRIGGLLSGAKRAGLVAFGADLVTAALREGKSELVVVAADAAAAAKISEVRAAIADGRAVAWRNKESLGALFGRDSVAVCAVCDAGVARAIRAAYCLSRPFVGSRSEAWWSPEVR